MSTNNRKARRILGMPFKFSNRKAMASEIIYMLKPGVYWVDKRKRSASQNRWKNHARYTA